MAFTNPNQDPISSQVERFRDVEGVSTRRLDIGLWYLKHRKKFFLVLIIVLILTAAGTIGYSLYQFSSYLLVGMRQDEQNYLELTSGSSLITNKTNLGGNISYSEVRVIASHDDTSDLVAAITNSNDRSLLRFNYYFMVGSQKIEGGESFVLPDDTKYLMALGQKLPAGTLSAQLVVENIAFSRLDRHRINDWSQYRLERLNFVIEDAKFTPAPESGLSEKLNVGELRFNITNNSAYGYMTAPLSIILKSQGQIAAVNKYQIGSFRSGETRSIQISWPGRLPIIDQVDIVPDINILDDNIYLKYSSL